MKTYLKIILEGLLVTGVLIGSVGLSRGEAASVSPVEPLQDTTTTRKVQVTGAAEMRVSPNVAVVQLGVQTEADTAQDALDENNTNMQAVITALTGADIPSSDIQTQVIRLSPKYDFNNTNGTRTLTGYTASNIVTVRTENLDDLGLLLDQAVKAGANTIDNISFDITDPQKVTDQVREAAIEDAHHKAEQLAKLTGAALGPVLEIQESTSTPAPLAARVETLQANSQVPISPGSQSVQVQVQVTWTLVAPSP